MAFTERQEYKVEVIPPFKVLQVRRADIIEKDGTEISRSYQRHVCNPGSDISGECAEVQAIAPVLWTSDVVAAYQAAQPSAEVTSESN